MSRIALLGCGGFIGSHLAECLLHDGWQVRGVDALTDTYEDLVEAGVIDPTKVVRTALHEHGVHWDTIEALTFVSHEAMTVPKVREVYKLEGIDVPAPEVVLVPGGPGGFRLKQHLRERDAAKIFGIATYILDRLSVVGLQSLQEARAHFHPSDKARFADASGYALPAPHPGLKQVS